MRLDDVQAAGLAAQAARAAAALGAEGRCSAGYALAVVAEVAQRRLGLAPYPTQLLAAWMMLEGRFAEMATGEGKTLAAGLGAAAAALAGVPVHLLTANDYLVQRDRDKLAPLYEALGLSSACVLPAMTRAEREAAYRCDIVYLTARELAFDYLRDHLLLSGVRDPRLLRALAISQGQPGSGEESTDFGVSERDVRIQHACGQPRRDRRARGTGQHAVPLQGPAPVLPGLCLALIDEADSILLDEATVPLILAAAADATQTQSFQRAMDMARALRRGRDYTLNAGLRRAELNDDGRAAVTAAVQALHGDKGLLRPARRAHELVAAALSARHALQRDRDYTVQDGKLQLIDEVTGRIADGRQWTGPLQAMVELKEGLAPSPATRVSAQITYQRFFPRYLRIGGMSGTLAEARRELRVLYDGRVQRVPLAKPDRRQWLGEQLFADTRVARRGARRARQAPASRSAARCSSAPTAWPRRCACRPACSPRASTTSCSTRCRTPTRPSASPAPAAPAWSPWPPTSPDAAPTSCSTPPRARPAACTSWPRCATARAASTAS